MSKIIKTTRWHGSTNFIRKRQIVNYCISTFYRNNNIFQISMFLWIELWTNPKHIPIIKKSMISPVSFSGLLLIVCKNLQWIIMLMLIIQSEFWTPTPLDHSPRPLPSNHPHTMTRSDIGKYINTHVFWTSCTITWLHILVISYLHWDLLLF